VNSATFSDEVTMDKGFSARFCVIGGLIVTTADDAMCTASAR
jgi:hypothetical protein